ncbi:MAG TPA: type II secretion system protein M [Noviherbaspirillum sp.]|uniref:type II secretion system protein M n=1 Tax=Noviherbaspirillum sp. TaxID=1926288 RepID=UPI002D231A69|nr:type II secretion system protein M [Noviherbaspirillum sp.]HYD96443.1 type II secretion system protein M [Noviherbaspirillum sp.]
MNGLKQALSAFWGERNKREQNMLIAAVVVILVGLVYALLIDPALSGRAELEKTLPALRQQGAEVQALAKEAGALSGKTAAAPPAMTRESLMNSLARKGLKAQNVTVSGELARVQLNTASFAATTEWLNEMQRTARLAVAEAVVEANPEPDSVNASFTLRQQRGDTR